MGMSITPRTPVPLDPRRLSLPEDILMLICGFIDKSNLLAIASLSSMFYEIARPLQHRTVHIDMDLHSRTEALLDMLSSDRLLAAVRAVEVTFNNTIEGEVGADRVLARLVDMLPGMAGIREVHWNTRWTVVPNGRHSQQQWHVPSPIPRAFLDRIPSHTRLHTSISVENEPLDRARAFLTRLVGNQNLYSLSVHIVCVNAEECSITMQVLKEVLLSCPRLVCLPQIFVSQHRYVRSEPSRGWSWACEYHGLGLSGGEKPPALEELGIEYYPFGHEPSEDALNRFTTYHVGYPEKGSEIQYWVENLDWSRLRKLYIGFTLNTCLDFARLLAPKLSALKEIDFEKSYDHTFFYSISFLEQIPASLETLKIPGLGLIGGKLESITRHGSTLRKLTICNRFFESLAGETRSAITDANLLVLSKGLTNLEELALDLSSFNKFNDWSLSTFDIIAEWPRLRNIELWFALKLDSSPSGHVNPHVNPHVTVHMIRQFFGFFRKRNQNLQRLEFHSAVVIEPKRWIDLRVRKRHVYHWAISNSIHLICEASLRDVDAVDGFLRVTCPSLSAEMNTKLARLARGTDKRRKWVPRTEMELLMEVAPDGPATYFEWLDRLKLRIESQVKQKSVLSRLVSSVSSWIRC